MVLYYLSDPLSLLIYLAYLNIYWGSLEIWILNLLIFTASFGGLLYTIRSIYKNLKKAKTSIYLDRGEENEVPLV